MTDKRLLPLVVAVAVVLADQVTKSLALHLPNTIIDGTPVQGAHLFGPVYLELGFNRGIAFGLGSRLNPVVVAVVVEMIALLILGSRRIPQEIGSAGRIGLGLLLGGALGNLCDRVFRHHDGGVIDFINIAQIGHREYWPVFNVADLCITFGAILLAAAYASGWRTGRPPDESQGGDRSQDAPGGGHGF